LPDVGPADDGHDRRHAVVLDLEVLVVDVREEPGVLVVEVVVIEALAQGGGALLGLLVGDLAESFGDVVLARGDVFVSVAGDGGVIGHVQGFLCSPLPPSTEALTIFACRGTPPPQAGVPAASTTASTAWTVCSKSRSEESTVTTPSAALVKLVTFESLASRATTWRCRSSWDWVPPSCSPRRAMRTSSRAVSRMR